MKWRDEKEKTTEYSESSAADMPAETFESKDTEAFGSEGGETFPDEAVEHLQDAEGQEAADREAIDWAARDRALDEWEKPEPTPKKKEKRKAAGAAAKATGATAVRGKLIKLVSLGVFSVAILIFASIAWFTMSRENETDGLQMASSNLLFEIATYGTSGTRNSGTIRAVAPEYQSGTEKTISGTTYYVTDTDTDSLRLQYSTGESEIGPGGSGVCDLYIIPKRDGTLTLDISLNVVAFAFVDRFDLDNAGHKIQAEDENHVPLVDESGNPIYKTTSTLMRVSEINTTDFDITADRLEELEKDAEYLKGHIMFFGDVGNTSAADENDKYYYTDPKTNWIISKTQIDAEAEIPFYVPIRWMWPNTLGQLALQSNVDDLRSGIPVIKQEPKTATNDKGKMLEYLKTNQDIIFKDLNLVSLLNNEQKATYDAIATDEDKAEYLETIITVDQLIENADTRAYFDVLSNGYNKADLAIGSNIAYFMIEMIVAGK